MPCHAWQKTEKGVKAVKYVRKAPTEQVKIVPLSLFSPQFFRNLTILNPFSFVFRLSSFHRFIVSSFHRFIVQSLRRGTVLTAPQGIIPPSGGFDAVCVRLENFLTTYGMKSVKTVL